MLPGSLVLGPALADSLETSLCPAQWYTQAGAAGKGLKPLPLDVGGEFWKPQGIQAAL